MANSKKSDGFLFRDLLIEISGGPRSKYSHFPVETEGDVRRKVAQPKSKVLPQSGMKCKTDTRQDRDFRLKSEGLHGKINNKKKHDYFPKHNIKEHKRDFKNEEDKKINEKVYSCEGTIDVQRKKEKSTFPIDFKSAIQYE